MASEQADRSGIPPESENLRQTGARKFEARPDDPLPTEGVLDASSSDRKDSVKHLMDPVIKGETHQYDGVNPPGSFGREDDPKGEAASESDPSAASPQQARRPA